jgi:hypothetical protein
MLRLCLRLGLCRLLSLLLLWRELLPCSLLLCSLLLWCQLLLLSLCL